jgi:poly-gamma-glutamate biosynthesis protein PgsC/CapC
MPLVESIALGLLLGFFLYERLGLSAGGLVVPGYVALFLHRPALLAATLAVSLAAWALVHLAARWLIIFGRRRFLLTLLTGFALQYLLEWATGQPPWSGPGLDVIGFIIPGLIANEMERQRILPTLSALAILSVLVRLLLAALGLLEVW